ncbi:hypothetical protein EST38_g13605 [Candolleomyces aberdarensis]|uniref:Uncharacterized protein n=1 Tax=Candolleomyces aberdarensis TaxID=2316362 RepID=A0A4Q2D0C0_9AGAR|nr:hypothetical protein EST38_g13605 [Candolleomyces aberdarensis]
MAPPEEQHSKPRKRDQIKKFLKDPFGSRANSPSLSRTTSHVTVARGSGNSSHAAHDVAIPTPPAENTARCEIQSNQDNIDTARALNVENTFTPSSSTFDHDGGSPVSNPFPLGTRTSSQGEGETQRTTTHVENPVQDHSEAVVEGGSSDLSPRTQSNIPAGATSQAADEPQEESTVEHQPAGLAGKIYEGVKTTLRKVVETSDWFPPLKSVAAGLLVICDTVDVSPFSTETRSSVPIYEQAYGENKQEFDELLKRVEVLSKIMVSCPPDVSQENVSVLTPCRTLEEKQKILQAKVDPTRSRVERVMLAEQDKQEVLKLTQEIRFAIEIAMFDAIIENRVQTLQIVSGVDWLKEQINVIKDHTGTMGTIERTVQSLKRSSTFI